MEEQDFRQEFLPDGGQGQNKKGRVNVPCLVRSLFNLLRIARPRRDLQPLAHPEQLVLAKVVRFHDLVDACAVAKRDERERLASPHPVDHVFHPGRRPLRQLFKAGEDDLPLARRHLESISWYSALRPAAVPGSMT